MRRPKLLSKPLPNLEVPALGSPEFWRVWSLCELLRGCYSDDYFESLRNQERFIYDTDSRSAQYR